MRDRATASAGCGDHLGLVGPELGFHDVGAEEEVAGIPKVVLGHVALGRRAIRLLDEALDLAGLRPVEDAGAGLDVAVTDGGVVRLDAERHDVAGGGRLGRLDAERDEAVLVLHDMVSGKHGDDGVRAAA